MSPLVPFIGFCIVLSPLSAEVKRGFFEHNCFPYHIASDMLFKTFMQGVAHAALCGELRLQIATSVTLDVVIIASCLHRWHTKTSVVPSGPNPNCGLPMWLSGSFIVVQWLARVACVDLEGVETTQPFSTTYDITPHGIR